MSRSDGKRIGRFIVDSVIGAGGAGRVFKVWDPQTQQTLALKLTNVDEDSESGTILPRFKREFNIGKNLVHPHLIRIFEFGSMNKQLFYTMELIDGPDWSNHLNQFKSKINELESHDRQKLWVHIIELMIQASDALYYLHKSGLVHRDIKPGNLLITSKNELKVTDFGTMRNTDSYSQMTKTGSILGTVAYMSPEQTVTSKVDHRSDIYSLGLLAFESFTGQSPFDGPVMKQILSRSRQDIPDPRQIVPELPGSIAETLNRMVKRRPEDRFSNARELNVQLQATLEIVRQLNSIRLRSQTERPMLELLKAPVIGCDMELHRIHGALQNISTNPTPRVFLVQGGVGMGRTRLTVEVQTQAELIGRKIYGEPGSRAGLLALGAQLLGWDTVPETMPETFPEDFFNFIGKNPALLILEDLHKYSEINLDVVFSFLKYAVQQSLSGVEFPVVIILTTGDQEDKSRSTARSIRKIMRNFDEFHHQRLKSFSADEIRHFISALLPGPQEIFDLPERLFAVTSGNPFHVEHCVRHLVTKGVITHVGAIWVANLDAGYGYRRLSRAETPVELIRYASDRLRQLDEKEKSIVQLAALFPSRFTVDLLVDLSAESKESISAILTSVLHKGFIQSAPGINEGFMFTTPVLASWSLETFSSHNLKLTPDSAEQFINVFPKDPPVACRLASAKLAQRLKRPDIAMEILMKYAEQWYSRGWISPSMTAWREAMNIQTDTDGTLVLKCSLGIGLCMRDLGHWRGALAHFDELVHHSSRALKDTTSPNRTLTQVHIHSVVELADTMRRLGMANEAEKRMLKFMDITRQADLKNLHRKTLAVRARIRRDRNDLQFSEAIFRRLLQQIDPVDDRIETNRIRLDLAVTLWKKGQFDNALSILETAMIDNIKPDDILLTCRLKLVTGDISYAQGHLKEAQKHWRSAADIASNDMYPLERCAALIRLASSSKDKSKEENLLRVQSILHQLDLEELCLDRII